MGNQQDMVKYGTRLADDPLIDEQQDPDARPEDSGLQRLQAFLRGKEYLPDMAVGTGVAGLQYAALAVKTDHDVENEARLAELTAKRTAGQLGHDDQEEQLIKRSQMDPVRALAGEQRVRDEAMLASMGNVSAAARQAAVDAGRRAVAKMARAAGLAYAQSDLARRRQQEAEIEERISQKAIRQVQKREYLAKSAAGIAEPLATHMAGRSVPDLDVQGLRRAGWSDQAILGILRMVKRKEMTIGEANKMAQELAFDSLAQSGDVGSKPIEDIQE